MRAWVICLAAVLVGCQQQQHYRVTDASTGQQYITATRYMQFHGKPSALTLYDLKTEKTASLASWKLQAITEADVRLVCPNYEPRPLAATRPSRPAAAKQSARSAPAPTAKQQKQADEPKQLAQQEPPKQQELPKPVEQPKPQKEETESAVPEVQKPIPATNTPAQQDDGLPPYETRDELWGTN